MPEISLDTETCDFGKVFMGQIPDKTIIVSNHGDGDLVIERIRPGHDCLVANMENVVIPPGQREALTVALNTMNMMNKCSNIHRTIAIYSNDPLNRDKRIELEADLHADFRLRNPSFAIQNARKGMILKDRIQVQSNMDAPLKFYDFKSEHDFIECSLTKGSEDDLYFLDLTADLRGKELRPGPLSGNVLFRTNSPHLPEWEIGFVMNVIQDIEVEPQRVTLYRIRRSTKDEEIIRLTNVLDKRFSVNNVFLDLDCVDIEILSQGGTTSDIRLRMNEKVAKGRYQVKLKIGLDYKTPEFIEVPVEVIVR
jgi:hypothetical protein